MIENIFISAIIVLSIMGCYVGIDLGKNKPRFYKNCEMKFTLLQGSNLASQKNQKVNI